MCDLINNLKKMAESSGAAAELLLQAAERIEGLDARQAVGSIAEHYNTDNELSRLRTENDQLKYSLSIQSDSPSSYKNQLEYANNLIDRIAEAAGVESGSPSDAIIARVQSFKQQTDAIRVVCEKHIAIGHAAEAKAARYSEESSQLLQATAYSGSMYIESRDKLREIATAFGAGANVKMPSIDWFLCKIRAMQPTKQDTWDRQKTKALEALLKEFKLWPTYSNVEGLGLLHKRVHELKEYAANMDSTVEKLDCCIVDKNAQIEKLTQSVASLQAERNSSNATLLQVAAALQVNDSCADWHTRLLYVASSLMSSPAVDLRLHIRDLEECRKQFDMCKNRIAAANARWNVRVVDPTNYVMQLEFLLEEIGVYSHKAANAQKVADQASADTKFISSMRDALSHEIARREH